MPASERRILNRAAALLEWHAQMLFDSEVISAEGHPNFGKVEDPSARNEISEHRRLAACLRAMAKSTP